MKKDKLKFNKKKHTYQYGKIKLDGVTTWIKKFFGEFDEKAVAKKLKYIYRAKGINKGIREILKEWKDKRELGNQVHKELEDWCVFLMNGGNKPKLSKRAEQGAVYLISHIKDKTEIKVIPELKVYDEKLKLAGTIDCLIVYPNQEFEIIDWKTNDSIKMKGYDKCKHPVMIGEEDCNYTHYTLQLSLYAYLMEKAGWTCKGLYLVQLKEDDYNLFKVNYRLDKVEEMLRWDKKLK